MKYITASGPIFLVILIGLRWWSQQDRKNQRHLAINCGLSTSLGLLFNQIILLGYHRIRPNDAGLTNLIVERSTDPSFPSDHATVAFAITASLLLARDRRSYLFLLLSILISFSRIFVGTHYLTDIIGGAATGALASILISQIYNKLDWATQKLVKLF